MLSFVFEHPEIPSKSKGVGIPESSKVIWDHSGGYVQKTQYNKFLLEFLVKKQAPGVHGSVQAGTEACRSGLNLCGGWNNKIYFNPFDKYEELVKLNIVSGMGL